MENMILIGVILFVVGFASRYLIKARKRGVKCIGCPAGGSCCGCKCAAKKD